ncbi:MAG: hypothetical protein LUG86_03115 [Oscillospiraceae bacterium]|nr:hypothetical protein [Oscillospiraceae bacterium]
MGTNTNHFRRNLIFALLSVIVLVVFFVMAYNYKSRTSEQKSRLEAAVAEAKQYEDEVTELKRSITSATDALSDKSDTARFVVGYVVSSEEDIATAEAQAAEYGFEPLIVLDCIDDLTVLEGLALVASDAGHEIMLTASVFTVEANETVKSLLSYMSENGIDCADIFLLRSDYSSSSNVELVISDGFSGYTIYNSTPTSGITDDGYITFDYSFLTVDSTSLTRFSSSYSNLASMVVAIELDSVRAGTLTDSFISKLLTTLAAYSKNDDCEFTSIAGVAESLLEENESAEERLLEYEAYVAECEARIDELEEIIAEIYSQLD